MVDRAAALDPERAHDRFTGALLGLACGDALGAPVEFLDAVTIRAKHGRLTEMIGGGLCDWRPGEWTDDTAQALAVARGILESPDDPVKAVGRGFLAWKDTRPKDIGATTSAAFRAFAHIGDWHRAARDLPAARSGRAAGNGSLMRTLPVALAYPDAERVLARSARISAMTHWDPMAETCCAIHGLWVRQLLRGAPPREAWHAALDAVRECAARPRARRSTLPGLVPPSDACWQRLAAVTDTAIEALQPTGYAGWSLDCLEAAAWCVLRCDTYEEAMITAVHLGGETDTIAAVAGGPAGALHGVRAIPARWLATLHQRDVLAAVARDLQALRQRLVYTSPGLEGRPFAPHAIDEGVLVGRNPLTALDVGELARRGVTAVVDLRQDDEWTREDGHGAEAIASYGLVGIERLHLPTRDTDAPSAEALGQACGFIARHARDAGADASGSAGRVYVHCRAGVERTGAVMVALVAREQGVDADAALAAVRARVPWIAPLPHQMSAVAEWLREAESAS